MSSVEVIQWEDFSSKYPHPYVSDLCLYHYSRRTIDAIVSDFFTSTLGLVGGRTGTSASAHLVPKFSLNRSQNHSNAYYFIKGARGLQIGAIRTGDCTTFSGFFMCVTRIRVAFPLSPLWRLGWYKRGGSGCFCYSVLDASVSAILQLWTLWLPRYSCVRLVSPDLAFSASGVSSRWQDVNLVPFGARDRYMISFDGQHGAIRLWIGETIYFYQQIQTLGWAAIYYDFFICSF